MKTKGLSFTCMLVVVATMALGDESLGEVRSGPLEELARGADVILIGKVNEKGQTTGEVWVQPITQKKFPFLKAIIEADSVIKGDSSLQRVQVYYLTIGDTFGERALHRPSVFFIYYGRDQEIPWNKPMVMTTAGDVPIDGHLALTGRITGEPKHQPLNQFVEKVQSSLSLPRGKTK